MNTLKLSILTVVLCLLSFIGGKYSNPAVVKTVEVVKIIKEKETEKEQVIIKKETINKDGSKVIETKTESKEKSKEMVKSEQKKQTEVQNRPEYRLGLVYIPGVSNIQDKNIIVEIQKHIVSDIYIGVSVSEKKEIGLSINIGI
jgi:hypothetical protein